MIWLFDPDKYRDPIVHDEFLAQLAQHQSQFIFALNKIDRLRPDDLQTVREDLFETLAADGYPRPALFALAADPPGATPRGIELFREHVTERIDTKTVMLRKVIRDAAGIVRAIGKAAGVWEGVSVDFDKSWARVRAEVLAGVGSGSSQADREDALCRLEDLTALIAVKSGPLLGEEVRDVADRAVIEAIVADLAEAGPTEPVPHAGLWEKLTGSDDNEVVPSPRADLLESKLGVPLRSILWRRGLLAATIAHAAVGAVQLEDKLSTKAVEATPG